MNIITKSEFETFSLGSEFAKKLKIGDCVILSGELGSGKTIFVKGLAIGLNIDKIITSPTFTIIKEYTFKEKYFLYHIDLYRITDDTNRWNLLDIDNYLFPENGITVIEWGENLINKLKSDYYHITIRILDGNIRSIIITSLRD